MNGLRTIIISAAVVLVLAASIAVPRIVSSELTPAMRPARAANPAGSRPERHRPWRLERRGGRLDSLPRHVDLRGNEIARPVARYRVDRRGTLYEVHSPQTEVPRLKAPTL